MNRRDDVLAIRKLLNAHLPKYASPLRVDGLYGLRTYEAIRKIHQNLVRMAYPDGQIDPQGPTLRLLNNAKLSGGAPNGRSLLKNKLKAFELSRVCSR